MRTANSFHPSDHFDGRRFFNPKVDTSRGFKELLNWRMSRQPVRWPAPGQQASTPPSPAQAVDGGSIAVTYIGQATVLIQCAGVNILTDPMFSLRASPLSWLGPKRVRDPGIDFDDLPPIHAVLLSHNHYDHMDLPSLRRLQDRWAPVIVTGLGNGAYLARNGIGGSVELDWWQHYDLRLDLRVHFVPAQHWSNRLFAGVGTMLWGGHVVETPTARVYFAGDTGYPAHFSEIRKRLGEPDVALLPIGAYEPRWFMGPQHMNPDDAVRAHLDLGARLSVAMHFATFRLSDEGIDEPLAALAEARMLHGVPEERFRVPEFGEPMVCQ
jgi:L-ascorbate metabolism protein UlaG (beta-lactamase superfamily)